jgi:DNA-directed RNA polymerase I subunit RPA2
MVVMPNTTPDMEPLRELFRHQIESFDYMSDKGLSILFDSIKPVKIHDPTVNMTLSISLENPELHSPKKELLSRTMHADLLPHECRQAKISYTGKLTADVCFKYETVGKRPFTVRDESYNFGQFPIMLKVGFSVFLSFHFGYIFQVLVCLFNYCYVNRDELHCECAKPAS